MENDIQTTVTSTDQYATITHQKAEVGLVTISKDKMLMLLSVSGSLSANFFALMIGIALTIFIALKSGGVEEGWKQIFWLAFWFSLVLVAFFGALTMKDEYKKLQFKSELKKAPTTPQP